MKEFMKENKKKVAVVFIALIILVGLVGFGIFEANNYVEKRDEACMKNALFYTAYFQTSEKVFVYLNATNDFNSISIVELCSDK